MSDSKDTLSKSSIKLSIPQNILLIINSLVVLFIITQVALMYPYVLSAPFLLIIVVACLIPLLKSKTRYSRAYIRAQLFLAVMTAVAVIYYVLQLINDRMGVYCTSIMGGRSSCIDSMWFSASWVFILVSIPAAILSAYGLYTQLRLRK